MEHFVVRPQKITFTRFLWILNLQYVLAYATWIWQSTSPDVRQIVKSLARETTDKCHERGPGSPSLCHFARVDGWVVDYMVGWGGRCVIGFGMVAWLNCSMSTANTAKLRELCSRE